MTQRPNPVDVTADGDKLRTERDVVESLRGRVVSINELYEACEIAQVTARADRYTVVRGRIDTRSRRRTRGALQNLRRAGRAKRVADGTWPIDGSLDVPQRLILVLAGDVSRMELVLSSAEKLLQRTVEPPTLVLADPPWAMGMNATGCATRDNGERTYARDPSHLVGGYRDIPPEQYREFTERSIAAAAQILTPGSYLVVITGPGQAARVQTTAEDLGQTQLRQPSDRASTLRAAHVAPVQQRARRGHDPLRRASPKRGRFFAVPQDLPRAPSGRDYPLDVWSDLGKHERRGLVRYPTIVHPAIPSRLIRALTPGPENGGAPWQSLVVDPFSGRWRARDCRHDLPAALPRRRREPASPEADRCAAERGGVTASPNASPDP